VLTNPFSSPLSAPTTPARAPQTPLAQVVLNDALISVDERWLAAELRVSVPTLRRYASGALRMNWVMRAKLIAAVEAVHAARATRSAQAARSENSPAPPRAGGPGATPAGSRRDGRLTSSATRLIKGL
jgi:hypothetical protein